MSIQVVMGKPRAGKSYQCVQRAYDAIEKGRAVVTNLPLKTSHPFWAAAIEAGRLKLIRVPAEEAGSLSFPSTWQAIREDHSLYFEVEEKTGKRKVGPLIICDEATSLFKGLYAQKKRFEEAQVFNRFLETHGHSMIDIVFMFHDAKRIPTELVSLVETFWTVANQTDKGLGDGWRMLGSTKHYGVTPKNATENRFGRFEKKIFELYDSYSEGNSTGSVGKTDKSGLFKRSTIWRRPWVVILVVSAIAAPVSFYFAFQRGKSVLSGENELAVGPVFGGAAIEGTAPVEGVAGEAAGVAAGSARSLVLEIEEDGLPAPGAIFVGFSDRDFFFPGRRIRYLTDLAPKGWSILEAEQCSVVFVRDIGPEVEFKGFRCADGL